MSTLVNWYQYYLLCRIISRYKILKKESYQKSLVPDIMLQNTYGVGSDLSGCYGLIHIKVYSHTRKGKL